MERETGIEPATFSLARRCSTTEPLPLIHCFCMIKISYQRRFVNSLIVRQAEETCHAGQAQGPHIHTTPPLVPTFNGRNSLKTSLESAYSIEKPRSFNNSIT